MVHATKHLILTLLILGFAGTSSAQVYAFASSPKKNFTISEVSSSIELANDFKSEGAFLIKDGQLDEIYNLKFNLPTANKKITFEQTHVMVLSILGMVHFVGTLDIDGVRSTASFQLGFLVNSDQSITFKGTKSIQLSELSKDELKLNIDFVLKNNRNDLAFVTAK